MSALTFTLKFLVYVELKANAIERDFLCWCWNNRDKRAYVYCNCQLSQNGRKVEFNQSFGKKGVCLMSLILSLPNVAKGKFRPISKFNFLKVWEANSIMWKYRQRAFIWMVHRRRSTDSKVRVALQNSIKHPGSERVSAYNSVSLVA